MGSLPEASASALMKAPAQRLVQVPAMVSMRGVAEGRTLPTSIISTGSGLAGVRRLFVLEPQCTILSG